MKVGIMGGIPQEVDLTRIFHHVEEVIVLCGRLFARI